MVESKRVEMMLERVREDIEDECYWLAESKLTFIEDYIRKKGKEVPEEVHEVKKIIYKSKSQKTANEGLEYFKDNMPYFAEGKLFKAESYVKDGCIETPKEVKELRNKIDELGPY